MHRLLRLSLFVIMLCVFIFNDATAQYKAQVFVSGRIGPDDVRVFLKDSVYVIDRDLLIAGTLLIEPGTSVYFYPQGRIIDSVGGRIIADGFAKAHYDKNPLSNNGVPINPVEPPGPYNPYSWDIGYATLDYFLFEGSNGRTIQVNTVQEQSVNRAKYNHIFNVVLDKDIREIRNLTNPLAAPGGNKVIVPFEKAIIFYAARMNVDPESDVNLKNRSWERVNEGNQNLKNVDIGTGSDARGENVIKFIGQPMNNFSREWGHIIILPGARTAFFRNCSFNSFRKDTTVDRKAMYNEITENSSWNWPLTDRKMVNNKLRMLTNGSGGVITTFSSRTWLINCDFTDNMARLKGGALAVFQAPYGYPMDKNYSLNSYYLKDKNPNITDPEGNISSVNMKGSIDPNYTAIPAIDYIDETTAEPTFNVSDPTQADYYRQAYDDGRIAMYLGRMRNLKFMNNKVLLADVEEVTIPGNPPIKYIGDVETANYPYEYGNLAYGGAIYLASSKDVNQREIEVGLGVNQYMKINQSQTSLTFTHDEFVCTGNRAINYQASTNNDSYGARGGAIYIGKNTSLIVAGQVDNNEAHAYNLIDNTTEPNRGFFALGGAIFAEKTYGRLQVRGGPTRDQGTRKNQTEFIGNKAGAGGAIYVDDNQSNLSNYKSPIIGGTDETVNTRDYGYYIRFMDNDASSFGGAIYTKRNMSVYGAGGVVAGSLVGYGGKFPVLFENNTAGYAGGAIDLRLPYDTDISPIDRTVQVIRALFRGNEVAASGIADANKPKIRGGGAIYSLNASINVVKAVEFDKNKVYNGNGGAIAMVHPQTSSKRFFLSDLDQLTVDKNTNMFNGFNSENEVFTFGQTAYPPDTRMLTRFFGNEIEVEPAILASQSGSGTTQIGKGSLGTTENLYGASFLTDNSGYAVGSNGIICKITNGGSIWKFGKSPNGKKLNSIYFVTSMVGFALGDNTTILKTYDGGETWNVVYEGSPVTDRELHAISFAGSNVGYVVGDEGLVLKTVDVGETWSVLSSAEIKNLYSVFFTGIDYGYAVGELGVILKTSDGGASWNQKVSNTQSNLNDVYFTSVNTGYAIGNNGVILKTYDAGNTWITLNSGTNLNLNAFFFSDANTSYAVGEKGLVIKTQNNGESWTTLDKITDFDLYDVYFAPTRTTGYATGANGLLIKTNDAGANWTQVVEANRSLVDAKRYHEETALTENGVGLGGAIYILDNSTIDRVNREDTVSFNRVRLQDNKSYTGAAIYSDNYDLKLIFSRSLITGNEATSTYDSQDGKQQNVITGPVVKEGSGESATITQNWASSDLAGAIIYGEIQGPLPSTNFSWAANSIYNNKARFIIRLPDAPNTKGVLAGTTGIGFGGTDTLRGNYWGKTEANVKFIVDNRFTTQKALQETFFIDSDGENHLPYKYWTNNTDRPIDPKEQGPFESIGRYNYNPIPLLNKDDQFTPDPSSIPEFLLMSGRIYDLYDKGTDVKTADYTKRRMSPIEDFAVGIPPVLRRYETIGKPSYQKYIKRLVRDPFIADSLDDDGNVKYPFINTLQTEFLADEKGEFYHPIGYPLFLEAQANYDGLVERNNHDPSIPNETVFFVINETTGDYIRINLKQISEEAPFREVFRARVELVPDSSNRNPNTTIRRTAEGLLNLGRDLPGSEPKLLKALFRNADNEDAATLVGRRYSNDTTTFGFVQKLFYNRPSMPASNRKFGQDNATYYAGERYRALPVDTGDIIRVISRTELWSKDVNSAFNGGLLFKITHSTRPAVFTGDIVHLMNDTIVRRVESEYPWRNTGGVYDTLEITEFLHKVFITEDRMYPVPIYMYSNPEKAIREHGVFQFNQYVDQYGDKVIGTTVGMSAIGRDSILNVTAIDLNKYYDPRYLQDGKTHAQLYYSWKVDQNSGLKRWLRFEKIFASDGDADIMNPKDNALGYLILRGKATNPYVVPGGEYITVSVDNFPPHYRTLDSLRNMQNPPDADQIDQFIEIFPPYLHAPKYDVDNARYLQQDTINVGQQYERQYTFQIFVVDSVPVFLDPDLVDQDGSKVWPKDCIMDLDSKKQNVETIGTYEPSVYPCRVRKDGRLKANLTNKLRFQVDFNTNDELEDSWAEAKNWDFRYGRTAYGFMNLAYRPDDKDGRGGESVDMDTVIGQDRPIWMNNEYIFKYDSDTDKDDFATDFTMKGQLNIRIPYNVAVNLIEPPRRYLGALNTDTVFTLVANDGHGGISNLHMPVMVNVEPVITTNSLPPAKEDIDYNPQLLDSAKMITFYDPNFDQDHWFELVYPGDSRDRIPRDPCFPDADPTNYWDLTNLKTTPLWLKINRESGLLYGTPRVKDAPRVGNDLEKVTVICWDEDSLSTIKVFDLRVDSTRHKPKLLGAPTARCIDQNTKYIDTLLVYDRDLNRGNSQRNPNDITDTLDLKVIQPSGITIQPTQIIGKRNPQMEKDTMPFVVFADNFNPNPGSIEPDGRITIKIEVKDKAGFVDTLVYRIKFSEVTDFVCNVRVQNNKGAFQILQFGTGIKATAGDGLDGEQIGHLDSNYCEYEIPPIPHTDIFDTRWSIPNCNGILRSIFLTASDLQPGLTRAYRAIVQSGGEAGVTSNHYPITISWNMSEIPATDDQVRNPAKSSWFIKDPHSNGNIFSFDMRTGDGLAVSDITYKKTGNVFSMQINRDFIDGFVIIHDWTSDVNEQPLPGLNIETKIVAVSPNPFSKSTDIKFGVKIGENVRVEIIDQLGKVVKVIADSYFPAQEYTISWDGRDNNGNELASGTYTCRMIAGSITSTQKVVIIK